MTLHQTRLWIVGILVISAILLVASPNRAAQPKPDSKWDAKRTTPPEDLDEIRAIQERVKSVVDKSTPCTVAILIGLGTGSGVIVSEDGLVLTSAQVLIGADPIAERPLELNKKPLTYEAGKECIIVLANEKRVKAKSLGVNTETDCGMVKITDKGPIDGKWPFLSLDKSGALQRGQWVVSLGHPGGPKAGRQPVARLGRIERNTKNNVTSNCTLVTGDFGGPLLNLDGNVVGVHSRIFLSLSMNYHIPAELFKTQWDNLASGELFGNGVAKKPTAPPPIVGVIFPEDENDDAWITAVDEGGPAEKGGIKPGDTITRINDIKIKSVKQFRDVIKDLKPGDTVKMTVRRVEKSIIVSVVLENRKP